MITVDNNVDNCVKNFAVRYSTAILTPMCDIAVLKIKLTENGSSQGPNTFTYERCPLGLFMVRRICTWVIDKYSLFNLKDRCANSKQKCAISHIMQIN